MKRINYIFIILLIALSLILLTNYTIYAEDDAREIVSIINAESNDVNLIPVYGEGLIQPSIEVTDEENPAYFNTNHGYWQKKINDEWEDVNNTEVFKAGIWRYRCNIYIDTTPEHNNNLRNGTTHRLADKITVRVKINGIYEEWIADNSVIGSNYSYAKVYSNEYIIPEPETLTVYDYEELNIKKNKAGIPIKDFSVSSCVEGGIKPYNFTKKSGPDWINVSNDGVVSGIPKTEGENEDLVIQISDSSDEPQTKLLTISVAYTEPNPELRENITEIIAESENINNIPKSGETLKQPHITDTSDGRVVFYTKNITWQKRKIDEQEWTIIQPPEKFSEGIWRYSCSIYVNNSAIDKYKLYEGTKVFVNGEEWEITNVESGEDYSSAQVYSNEYYINESGTYIVTFNTDKGSFVEGQIIQAGDKVTIPNNPTKEGFVFDGWYADKEFKRIFNFNKDTIASNTVIYAKWHKHDLKYISGKNATCTSTGILAHYKCSICDKLFKDNKGTQEISSIQTIVPKIAHTYKDEVISKEKTKANLTKNGKIVRKIQTKCSECGDIIRTRNTTEIIYYAKTIKLSKNSFKYNKKVQRPNVIVKDCNGNIIDESNYTVTYSNKKSKKVGEYKVTIIFKNKYKGKKELNYIIKPQGTTLKQLKAGVKQLKITWKKNLEQTSGYQIKISTDKNFSKNIKKIIIEKNKTISSIIKKLKSKKKYFIIIRTYKLINGKRIYSSWSESKKVKTK